MRFGAPAFRAMVLLAVLALAGCAAPAGAPCQVPAALDFFGVPVGRTATRPLVLANPSAGLETASLGVIRGSDAFSLSSGSLRLLPRQQGELEVSFAPAAPGEATATVTVQAGSNCSPVELRLLGTGVVDELVAEAVPAPPTAPGATSPLLVTFTNRGRRDVGLSGLAVLEGGGPSAAFRLAEPVERLTVPAAGRDAQGLLAPRSATVAVAFSPTALGVRTATLVAESTLAGHERVEVPLRGPGAGPRLALSASLLNVGTLSVPAGPVGRAQVLVRNAGTFGSALHLGRGGVLWRVAAEPGADPDELCVGDGHGQLPPGAYDGSRGLGAGEAVAVPLAVTPRSEGRKAWLVTLLSDDPAQPEVALRVVAEALALPDCRLEVTPSSLEFGLVSAPVTRVVTLKNLTAGVCLVRDFVIDAAEGTWSFVAAPPPQALLQSSEPMRLTLQADRPAGGRAGRLRFQVSSAATPGVAVPLHASPGPADCLVTSPSQLDFGAVAADCAGPQRTLLLYDTCSEPVVVEGIDLVAAGGLAAGEPGCAGPSPCPSFVVTSTPRRPLVLQPGAPPAAVGLVYQSRRLGADTGALRVTVRDGAGTVEVLTALAGVGLPGAVQTDTFAQAVRLRSDVLFVIDDSPSFAAHRADVQRNLAAVVGTFDRARGAVDFHLGVTTTDDSPSGAQGSLVASPQGTKVFTGATPNLEAQFLATTDVGATGSENETCLAAAVKALTAPKATDPAQNGGFLRADAPLAVVCITDALEHSAPLASLEASFAALGPRVTWTVVGPFSASPPAGCSYEALDDGVHRQLAARFSGSTFDVCDVGWGWPLVGFSDLGWYTPRSEFYLSAMPAPGTLPTVEVNGVVVPEVGVTRNWSWDPLADSIRFEPAAVPPEGARVQVTFVAACGP